MPKFWARFSGGLMSVMYAYAVVNEAPATPASARPTNNQAIVGAMAIIR